MLFWCLYYHIFIMSAATETWQTYKQASTNIFLDFYPSYNKPTIDYIKLFFLSYYIQTKVMYLSMKCYIFRLIFTQLGFKIRTTVISFGAVHFKKNMYLLHLLSRSPYSVPKLLLRGQPWLSWSPCWTTAQLCSHRSIHRLTDSTTIDEHYPPHNHPFLQWPLREQARVQTDLPR